MKRFLSLSFIALLLAVAGVVLWHAARSPQSRADQPAPFGPAATGETVHSHAAAPAVATVIAAPVDVVSRFREWSEKFSQADASGRAGLLAAGVELAKARRAEMVRLIQSDPERALREAVPYAVRQRLPADVQRELEQPVTASGRFTTTFYCDPEHKHEGAQPAPERHFRTADHLYDAYVYGWRAQLVSHDSLPLHGIVLDEQFAASADPARVLSREETDDLVASGTAKVDSACRVCGRALTPASATLLDLGGGEYHTTCARDVQTVNDGLRFGLTQSTTAEGAAQLLFSEYTGELWDQLRQLPQFAQAPQYFGGSSSSPNPPIAPAGYLGQRRLLLIPAQFADEPAPPVTQQAAETAGRQVGDRFNAYSYGHLQTYTTVTPPVILPHRRWYYDEAQAGAIITDAIAQAARLGYITTTFDLPQLYVITTAIPSANFGGISSGLVFGTGALVHEIGHNLGLGHANYFDNSVPPNPAAVAGLPFDTDSRVGHPDLNAPFINSISSPVSGGTGSILEYGDRWDTMGGGGSDYSAAAKNFLGWLPRQFTRTVLGSETNRIYAFDQGGLTNGRLYALQVQRRNGTLSPNNGPYWLSHRRAIANNPWLSQGLLVQHGTTPSLLLDTTPGTPDERDDSAIACGRTFNDPEARLYITPITRGGTGADAWVDVIVNRGTFPGNNPPVIANFTASALNVPVGTTVTFTTTASDPDNDTLAYHYAYSDGTFDFGQTTVTRTFTAVGNYVVRCEVSDMRGGVDSTHLIVRVGTPDTYNLSGRVVDNNGVGVPGVRVHNGISPVTAAGYRYGLSDARGYYTIPDLDPGTYEISGYAYRWRTEPLNYNFGTVAIGAADVTGVDLLTRPLVLVSASVLTNAAETNIPGVFRITRTGPPTNEITVRYSALSPEGALFSLNPGASVTLSNGQSFADVTVTPVGDTFGDGGRTVVLTLGLAPVYTNVVTILTNAMLLLQTNVITVPGWERGTRRTDGATVWFQTYPNYFLGDAEATMLIQDDDAPGLPVISVTRVNASGGVVEGSRNASGFVFTRGNALINTNLTVNYTLGGTATNGVDYLLLPTNVTIQAGQAFAYVPVVPINNQFVDGNRVIILTPVGAPGYSVVGGAQTVTIADDDRPAVLVYASDPLAGRGGNGGQWTLVRVGDLDGDLAVNYLLTGTAVSGVDYVALSGVAVIPSGQRSVNLTLTPTAVASSPGPKTAVLLISDAATYNILGEGRATVRIADAVPTVNVTAGGNATEGGAAGSFTVTRTGPATNALVVYYQVGGTANANTDYAGIGTSVTIPSGQNSVSIPITPLNDNFREFTATGQNNQRLNEHEYVEIALRQDDNYELGNNSDARVTITDDDAADFPMVGFMQASSVVREDAGSVRIPVRIAGNPTNQPAFPIRINWSITGGTAILGTNYSSATSGQFQFDSNAVVTGVYDLTSQNQLLTISILNDTNITPDRTLILTLDYFTGFLTNGFQTNTILITNIDLTITTNFTTNALLDVYPTNAIIADYKQHTLLIEDVSRANVSIATVTTPAREAGVVNGAVRVTRTGNTASPVTVKLFADGSAVAGADYVPLPTEVTIPAGTNSILIPIVPIDDVLEEEAETVRVQIIETPDVRVTGSSAQVVIISNDGTVQFTAVNYQVFESVGVASVTVIRTGESNDVATVDYTITGGSAVNGVDYLGTNGTLTFQPGQTLQIISIPVLNDTDVEVDKTVEFTLSNSTGGAPLGGQDTATLTIRDDDLAMQFSVAGFSAYENATNAQVIVQRRGVTNVAVTVEFSTTDGSAVNGVDYTGQTNTLNFAIGEVFKTVNIPLTNDTTFETNETVLLRLANPVGTNTTLGVLSNAVLTILEDEARIEFAQPAFSAPEYGGFAPVVVRRLGGSLHALTVGYRASNLTASNSVDFNLPAGTLAFAGDQFVPLTNGSGQIQFVPGQTERTLLVPLIDDVIGEGQETFLLTLTNITGPAGLPVGTFALGAQTNTTVTILDDELPGNVDVNYAPVINPGLTTSGQSTTVAGTARDAANGQGIPGASLTVGGVPVIAGPGGVFTVPNVAVGTLPVTANAGGYASFSGSFVLVTQPTNVIDVPLTPTSLSTLFLFNFESGLNGFVISNNVGSGRGLWHRSTGRGFNLGHSASNSLYYGTNENVTGGGNYDVGDNEGAVLSPLLNLSNATAPLQLTFNYLLQTEGNAFFDFALVEISTNNGASYAPLLNANTGTGGFTNNTLGVWRRATNDLSAYAGQSVRLRFRFDTGDAILNNFEGWYLDDVEVRGPGGTNQAPQITQAPLDATAVPGTPALFSVFASGSGPLSYQWRRGGVALGGATNALLVLASVSAGDAGIYDVVVSNALGSVTSPGAALTLANLVQACGNGVGGGIVYALGIDAFDNKVVVGGNFATVNGISLPRVARLTPQGLVDNSFIPGAGANSNVWAVTVQGDSKVLLGGDFTSVGGSGRARVARLLFNGAIDPGFNVGLGANASVRAIAVQADGRVLVGGDFTAFAGSAQNAYLVRLNADGSVDTNFVASVNGPVQALAVGTNGGIYIGGCFTSAGGLVRSRVALLGSNGVADVNFNPGTGTDGVVRSVAVQADGRVLIGGAFSTYNNVPVGYVARLNANGTLDTGFLAGAGADGPVNAVVVAPQGKLFLAGAFRTFDGQPRAGYVRLRPDGSVDPMFEVGTGADGPVYAAVGQLNSAFVIGGNFGFVNGLPRTGLARIRGDETSNLTTIELSAVNYTVVENAGPAVLTLLRTGNTNGTVSILLSTTNGTAVTPGDYAGIINSNVVFAPGVVSRTVNVVITNDALPEADETFGVRLSGATLTTLLGFNTNAVVTIRDDEQSVRFSLTNYAAEEGSNVVVTIVRQGLATNAVSVSFGTSNGTARAGVDYTGFTNVVMFGASQTVATVTVNTVADGVPESPETVLLRLFAPVGVLLASPSNAVLTINDFLFIPGSLDTNFNPGMGANNFVRSVAFQADGKLVAGGAFTQMNGTNRNYVARLHGTGALDLGFDPGVGPDAAVSALAVQADGQVYVGGSFSNVSGARFNRVARLDTNGVAGPGFASPFTLDAALNTLTLRGDGRLFIGGTFSIPTIGVTRLTGAGLVESGFAPAPGLNGPVHAVAPASGGKVYVAGGFSSFGGYALNRLVRLNDDGAVDLTYVPADITGGVVFALAVQTNGQLIIGGSFTSVGGTNRAGIARLNTNGTVDASFNPGTGVDAPVYGLALQPNGKVILGGAFTTFNGAPAGRYVRLLDTGARDTVFDSTLGADDVVFSVAVARGRVALGGNFTTVNGLARRGVALLRADPGAPRFTQSTTTPPPFASQLETDAGVTYIIEATTDFVTWTPISTNTASGPLLPVSDPNTNLFPQRFYRSRVVEQ